MELNSNLAEIVGVYIGDGYIYKNKGKYQIGFVGSPKTDVELFERLKKIIQKEWKKEVNFKVRAKGLRMVFRSKNISNFLINYLGLPFGEGKCEKVFIPEIITCDWELVKYTIRGIMDTDGTVFVSKKPGVDRYPTMEITTTSPVLANQLSKRYAYRVPLYGKNNLKMWLDKIGFSNKYKEKRAFEYIQ